MTDEPTPTMLSRAHRAYVIAMCALIGGAFAYAACEWGRWPHLAYTPLSGELSFSKSPSITIHYVGLILWGLGGAVCGAGVGALLCRIAPRAWSERVLQLFGAWAITGILLAGGYFTWTLWPW